MRVGQFLQQHQSRVLTCRPEDTIQAVATILSSNHIGAMPVCDSAGKLVGVISERDLVRGFSDNPAKVLQFTVEDLMTRKVVTCAPDVEICDTMPTMARHRFRHLPVVDGEELVGMISVRDALGESLRETELEANVLRDNVIAARYR